MRFVEQSYVLVRDIIYGVVGPGKYPVHFSKLHARKGKIHSRAAFLGPSAWATFIDVALRAPRLQQEIFSRAVELESALLFASSSTRSYFGSMHTGHRSI
eukprot:3235145-Amphidinium_carterae.1